MHSDGFQTDHDAPQTQVCGLVLISGQRLTLSLSKPWQSELGQDECWISHPARLVYTYFRSGGKLLQ